MRSGQRVGKYVLGEQIARGGMAEVWAARVEGLGGFVKSLALKFILESFTGDPDLERLFLNEARVAAKLQHANLVGVFDFDKLVDAESGGPGRLYIAMERVDGHDLRRVVQVARHNGQRLPPAIALYVAGEVLKGLRYVHERTDESGRNPLGLVHRDVSPHNVLIGMGGEVKLSDFGIAKAMTQSLGTQTGTIRGKLAYASPEQLRGDSADHRTDQFGLGVTLWEMLADQRLFTGADEMEIIGKVMRCEIPPLPVDCGIDPAVEAVVRRMLAGQPGDRFPSTADALSAVLSAPGYSSDPTALAVLMRDRFGPRMLVLPPTVPLNVSAPPPLGGLAETSPLDRSPSAPPVMFAAGAPVGASAVASPGGSAGGGLPDSGGEITPGSSGSSASSRALAGRTGATPFASEASAGPSGLEPVTGSVSGAGDSSGLPSWISDPQVSPKPRRVIWLAVAVAVIGAGAIALIARRADHEGVPATTIVPDRPRPPIAEGVRQAAAASVGASAARAPSAATTASVATGAMPASSRNPELPVSVDEVADEKVSPDSEDQTLGHEEHAHEPGASPSGDDTSADMSRASARRRRHTGRDDTRAPAGEERDVGRATKPTKAATDDKGSPANSSPVLE